MAVNSHEQRLAIQARLRDSESASHNTLLCRNRPMQCYTLDGMMPIR